MKKFLIYILSCVMAGCFTLNEKKEDFTLKIQALENENKELQTKNTELVDQNKKLTEIAKKNLQRLQDTQDQYNKLMDENRDLYQKLYTERVTEQKQLSTERQKRSQELDAEAKKLMMDTEDEAPKTASKTKKYEDENLEDLENLENTPKKSSSLEAPSKSSSSLNKDKIRSQLAQKRAALLDQNKWTRDDEVKFVSLLEKIMTPNLSPSQEEKILQEATEYQTKWEQRIKK